MFLRILFLSFFYYSAFAQFQLGISTSNYGGTNSIFLNPANVAGTPYNTYIQVFGADAFLTNNYVSWNAPYSFIEYATKNVPAQYINTKGQVDFNHTFLQERLSTKSYYAHGGSDVRGPSVLFNKKNSCTSYAITTRVRTALNATEFDPNLARYLKVYGIDRSFQALGAIDAQFNVNANASNEVAFTIGKIYSDENYRIKLGGSIKYLAGLMNAYTISNNFDFEIINAPNSPITSSALLLKNVNIQYGYENSQFLPDLIKNKGILLNQKIAGHGAGFDIGFVYERVSDGWQSHRDKKFGLRSNYDFRISLALNDIGWIRYANKNVKSYDVQQNNITVLNEDIRTIKSATSFFDTINGLLGVRNIPPDQEYRSLLPTSLILGIDQKLGKNSFLNLTWVQNMKAANQIGIMQQNILAITPRYEKRWVELAMPISISNYQNFQMGLATRVGPVYVGADNLLGMLNLSKFNGFNAYAGLAIPIFSKPSSVTNCQTNQKDQNYNRTLQKIKKKN